MYRDPGMLIDDIRDAIGRIERYVEGLSREELIADERTMDAVIRNLEVIGEAAKGLPEDVRRKYPGIEWRKVVGLRNILIHDYSGVSANVIWDIVSNSIPDLKRKLGR